MHKKIVFALFIITTALHSMDLVIQQEEKVRDQVLVKILSWLYAENHFIVDQSGGRKYNHCNDSVVHHFGRDLQTVTCVNRFFSERFSKEKSAQKIIKSIAQHQRWMCDETVARCLNSKGGVFFTIRQKMDQLFDIVTDADRQFTPEDLQDSWYLNASYQVSHGWLSHKMAKYKSRDTTRPKRTGMKFKQLVEKYSPHTLLSLAFKTMDFEKIEQLLAVGSDCKNKINNNLLLDIAKKRCWSFGKHGNRKVHYCIIALSLLAYGADPDCTQSFEKFSPLMIAARNNDQEYAWLLLQYFVNSDSVTRASIKRMEYPFWYHEDDGVEKTAFDVEQGEPKGWLKEMVDTIDKQRSFAFKYWFLKNYTIDFYGTMQNIPAGVMRFIMYNLVKSHGCQL